MVDYNTEIKQRVVKRATVRYVEAGSPVPSPMELSPTPVRLIYSMSNDIFYVFYGVNDQPLIPWAAYMVRISEDGKVDTSSLIENIYFTPFTELSDPNINRRGSDLVDIPLPSSLRPVVGGKSKSKSKVSKSKDKDKGSKGKGSKGKLKTG